MIFLEREKNLKNVVSHNCWLELIINKTAETDGIFRDQRFN